jgi:hypothetical protein
MWDRLGQFSQSLASRQTRIPLDRTQSSRVSKTLASKRQKPHLASLISHLTASPFPNKMAAPCRLRSSSQLRNPGLVQYSPLCARDCYMFCRKENHQRKAEAAKYTVRKVSRC